MDKKNKEILTDLQKREKRRKYMREYYQKNKHRIYKYKTNYRYKKQHRNQEKPYFSVKRGTFIVTFD
tara:strand:+ start:79 stop:279 length:201 start_codon:yes stop_codon:yes gene_type:complete